MPTEPLQDVGLRLRCPVCGSETTEQHAAAAVEDRLRNAIAAHWAELPGPRGPDGRWLRKAIVAWAGLLALALVTSTSHWLARREWGASLIAALLLGAWIDRHVARRRGWIDPLQRAAGLAREAQARDAANSGAAHRSETQADQERTCLQCGHRFTPPAPIAASAA